MQAVMAMGNEISIGVSAYMQKAAEKLSFDKAAENAKTEAAGKSAEVSHAEMTMEEYKEYIYDEISKLPLHPSQALNNISIHISEAGFEAMKNDSEYEEWVLNRLKADFAYNNPWIPICGGGYSVHYFGASQEEYHGEGWYPGFMGGKGKDLYGEKSKDSFWERRAKNRERINEWHNKQREQERIEEAAIRRKADFRSIFQGGNNYVNGSYKQSEPFMAGEGEA